MSADTEGGLLVQVEIDAENTCLCSTGEYNYCDHITYGRHSAHCQLRKRNEKLAQKMTTTSETGNRLMLKYCRTDYCKQETPDD
jgi:hypothetical protein